MKLVVETAAGLQQLLDEAGRPFCFIGGVAVQRWGEGRMTKDADAAVLTELGDEQVVIETFADRYSFRNEDALSWATVHRLVLLQDPRTGVGLDLSLASSGFELDAIGRASDCDFGGGYVLRTCSAEDLIVYKAIAGILERQRGRLDHDLIDRQLEPLVALKEEPEIIARYVELKDRYA
ncbi:MAG: hypothetical protein AAF078_06895 [Planctomycetota bacterium]